MERLYGKYEPISKETQKDRLSKRGDDVTRMLELNKSFNAKENKKKATYVVDNNLDEASLHKNLDIIFDKVTRHWDRIL